MSDAHIIHTGDEIVGIGTKLVRIGGDKDLFRILAAESLSHRIELIKLIVIKITVLAGDKHGYRALHGDYVDLVDGEAVILVFGLSPSDYRPNLNVMIKG